MKHSCKNSIGARHFQHLLVSMKFTCLNKGSGYYFPPSYILDVSGFRILLDCPLDISALTIFSPLTTQFHPQLVNESSRYSSMDMEFEIHKRQKIEQPLDRGNFIRAEPWYKTVTDLHLWDPSSIDIVLISSMTGMLGLPFLTRNKGFSAKIYATEATASLGQLMMKDLVSMHSEFVHIYGLEPNFPQWLKWEELELLPSPLKEIAFGKDGLELGGWRPLYSSEDVQVCIQKVEIVKYAEETCYNGALILKAFSSGLEIGSCNWTIDSADADIASVSSSMFASNVATEFNYHALQGKDLILYSDFSANENMEDFEHGNKYNAPTMHPSSTLNDSTVDCKNVDECLLNSEELLEERDKLAFVCSCVVDSVRAGGSVLVALVQPSISLQLLEQIPDYLESSAMRVPVYVISSIASELLAFTNVVPEWLCKQRQEKLFSCQPLFSYAQHLKEKKLHLFPSIHSTELLTNWQEPCIIFASHWSLRLGPVVHLLQRWHGDRNSLLVLEVLRCLSCLSSQWR
ncbi:hypothetical protein K2173_012211 [Erythroxylum novogranatense]|uniref:Beta-Casp domain-containing protein n=1 Tax=Erythroxylum novogranatense TaxID=1862640 RepID=A0AAV8T9F1_9ROSI|nr:hypothetical protein K2173_012211 [Erythroxylum novogranatense]